MDTRVLVAPDAEGRGKGLGAMRWRTVPVLSDSLRVLGTKRMTRVWGRGGRCNPQLDYLLAIIPHKGDDPETNFERTRGSWNFC